ncbi:hypothetical protein ACIRRA_14780 [Nocardia sp. NPDC101769]|uniref:hypothetical protein n=1 Tax=Nocardia sp. NPDC101769 TaxID=3364333 RepID=UPI003811342A
MPSTSTAFCHKGFAGLRSALLLICRHERRVDARLAEPEIAAGRSERFGTAGYGLVEEPPVSAMNASCPSGMSSS